MKITYRTQMIMMLIAILGISGYATAQSAEMKFNANEITVQEGDTFHVKVLFNTNEMPVSVFDIHLQYETEYLQVIGLESLDEGFFSYHVVPNFDNSLGKVDMAAFQIGKQTPSGNFEVVQITFLALAPTGLTKVYHPMDVFPKSLLAYGGTDILENADDLKVTITESGTVGIDDINKVEGMDLSVWPNPSSDVAFVSFRLQEAKQVVLSVFDLNGKLIKELFNGNAATETEYKFEVEVSELASGSYQCVLRTGETLFTKAIVVAH
ncbi:T9SS type A sorting domain-containing protein [Cryomorpha ignava]|uniref:T9SS type A sorting domain-containing protein n=1 Tax=Cryomorpha ignava TaxID=101383 RepID=A0A7K3WRV4_9FLAO|nr:T9SS type A sorting domain-containing protein [Cryomorpha ignava]NEN23582.1 T9SS type A sorting domain-containing protein [Cryomorpha ignava]